MRTFTIWHFNAAGGYPPFVVIAQPDRIRPPLCGTRITPVCLELPHTVICIDHSWANVESGRRRVQVVLALRAILVALIAVAIALAPIVSAWATVAKFSGVHFASAHGGASEHGISATEAPMEDCASMMTSASRTENVPCCAKDKGCPPEFCLTKCFQLFSIDRPIASLARFGSAQFRPSEPEPPPDWSEKPRPPPPRT